MPNPTRSRRFLRRIEPTRRFRESYQTRSKNARDSASPQIAVYFWTGSGVIDWVLRVLGVKHQLRAVLYLVVYPSEDFPSSDVHREALVGGLLSPFF